MRQLHIYVPGFLGPPPTPPQWSCSVGKVAQCDPTSPPPPCGMGGGVHGSHPPPPPYWNGGWGEWWLSVTAKPPATMVPTPPAGVASKVRLPLARCSALGWHLVVALQTTNCVVASRTVNCDSAATCRVLQNEQIALQRITRTAPQTRPQRRAHTGASRPTSPFLPCGGRGGPGSPPPGWTHTIGGGGGGGWGRRATGTYIYIYIMIPVRETLENQKKKKQLLGLPCGFLVSQQTRPQGASKGN